jgi:CRISPR-associated protein Csx17
MIVHRLDGCAPTPLAHYLKALGILRLVAEQLDPQARGWWEGEQFRLASEKDKEELIHFFLEAYAPTALVSPWNRGSGFFQEDDPALTSIAKSQAPRFERLRAGMHAARALLDEQVDADRAVRAIKGEAKDKTISRAQREAIRASDRYKARLAAAERRFKRLKADLIPGLRRTWRGSHREWMDAAIVLTDEGTARYPSLLGTGGADGRLDFTNNFFQRLGELFDFGSETGAARPASRSMLEASLFGATERVLAAGLAIGQFSPGSAGGANMTTGPSSDSGLNPWDFVLMMEGTVMFTAAATRRLRSQAGVRAAAPFAVSAGAAGYASAGHTDESARGEQWMPLWVQPTGLDDIRHLFTAGRAQLGPRTANEPLDLARAITRLGTSRGIGSFQRYGYIERNGQSNLAVPLGRFVVPDRAEPTLACLDDLDVWLKRLRREARSDKAPARLVLAERRLAEALLAVAQRPAEPLRWQTALLRMAEIEALQIHGTAAKAGPIPRLRPPWVTVADDGSAEHRLAAAFALQCADARARTQRDGVRRHWIGLDGEDDRSARVMQGRDGAEDAIALVSRRLLEAARAGQRRLPLEPGCGVAASLHDVARVVAGEVDLDRCLSLARALMALDTRACTRTPPRTGVAPPSDWPDDAWIAIRLALLPWPLPDGRAPGSDPAILRRLQSGDVTAAVALAARRLRMAGIRCPVSTVASSAALARRYAAALAFPVSPRAAATLAVRLDPSVAQENAA